MIKCQICHKPTEN